MEAQPKTNAIDHSQSSQSPISLTMKLDNNGKVERKTSNKRFQTI